MAVVERTSGGGGGVGGFVYETAWLGLRTLRRFYRVPANPVSIIIFPIIQLVVFSQLFRGIIVLPGFEGTDSYLAYLAPGQIVFTVFFAVAWSGGGLLIDYRAGYLDKLRATPANRYAIIAGELVTVFIEAVVMSAVILAITVVLGASIASGIPGAILIVLIAGAFGVAWAGTSMAPALLTRNEQATGMLAFLFIPIVFLSTAFVPAEMMPEWLQAVNVINPISYVIEAIRSLMSEGIILEDLWPAVVSIIVLIGVRAPLGDALGVPTHDRLAVDGPVRELLARIAPHADQAAPDLARVADALIDLAKDHDYLTHQIERVGDVSGATALHAPEDGPRLMLVHRLAGEMSPVHDHGVWVALAPIRGIETHRRYRRQGPVDAVGGAIELAEDQALRPATCVTLIAAG